MERVQKHTKTLSRSQRRRQEDIIQAALKVFDRDGFVAAKMSDIADEAEVAKGTLYLYFDTKVDLLEGVIAKEIVPTLQQIGAAGQSNKGTAKERLAQQIRIAAKRIASPEMKTLLRHMISAAPNHERIAKFYYDNVIVKGLEHIRATLDYGVETGEFRKEVKDIDALVLVGAPIYPAVWNILFREMAEIDSDKLAEDFLKIVLVGLSATD
ncbi:TetR/AcrR family transcriptional regulator [Ruegeria sp. THAF33]|uniref:TetR/AcrR family transcriptional regulator n=1 Tax=Ruegeria sp. THAF33 TaxID=2587853 RepID=UPI0012A7D464|nr:TetR/AcrR family transcriptional regulator [Ruegeria sp. THAF33]QFT75745.1 HTH-type transcriptional repressor KstR [Ruegeria sp. THAF33]